MENTSPEWVELGKIEFIDRACPVCGATTGHPAHRKITAGYEMEYRLCEVCDCLYTPNAATPDSLPRIFGSKEFFSAGEPGGDDIDYFDFIGGERYLRMTARRRIKRIKQSRPTGRLLEVASAAGFFLIEAKSAGYDVEGVEISGPMARYASHRWNVPVRGESIELIELPPEHYDVIASWGVMTVLQDPVAVIQKFHRALKPGGVWALNTYYHDCLFHKLVGSRWYILCVQTSQVFSKRLLIDTVTRHGFRLVSMRRDQPYSDLLKIADGLVDSTGLRWIIKALKVTGLSNVIIRIPLPDVYEYIWQKI